MKHINVDTAPLAVKKFIRSLAIDANGVEIELGGKVVCKVVPPSQLSEAQKAEALADVRELFRRSRARSKRVSARTIERDIREALATVRAER